MNTATVVTGVSGYGRMGSWTLLRTFIAWETTPATQSPVFKRESLRPPLWQAQRDVLARIPTFRLFALGVVVMLALRIADVPLATQCANALLILLLPPLLLLPSLAVWTIPLGFVVAPVVVRERVAGTWDVLRMTPYSTEDLLKNKAGGALWRLRGLLVSFGGLQAQVLAVIFLGLGVMEVVGGLGSLPRGQLDLHEQSLVCAGGILLLLGAVGFFLLDRIQHLLLMVVAALAVSATSGSARLALTRAVGATLLVWLADVAVAVTVLLLQPAGQVQGLGYSIAATVMMGPAAGYALSLPPMSVALLVAVTIVVREFAVRSLWRLAVRGASQI